MANLFLLPLKSLASLFGIESISAVLYNALKTNLSDKLCLSDRTFRDLLNGKKTPTQKTRDKISFFIPSLELGYTSEYSNYMTDWELLVCSPSYEDFPFPYFKKKFAFLAMQEASLIKEMRNIGSEAERIHFLFNHPVTHYFLNKDEISIITSKNSFDTDKKIVIIKLSLKMLLYCIAYIDAEWGISRKEDRGERFSFIKKILPKFNQDKYVNPIEAFFRLLKDYYKTTYAEVAKLTTVNTNNPDKTDSQIRKFRFWREGKKQASYDEIKNIFHTLEPEFDDIELNNATLSYYYALFLHNFFDEILKSKIDGIDIFKLDRELVDWIKIHYDDYFESAYIEIEGLIAKDASSIFG